MTKVEFESILQQVGDNGRFQQRLLFLVIIPMSIIMPLETETVLFMLSEPDHWCTVPEVSHMPVADQQVLIKPSPRDSCHYNDIDYFEEKTRLAAYKRSHNNSSDGFKVLETALKVKECTAWTFDNRSYSANAVTHFNLVCGRRQWKSTLLSLSGFGRMIALLASGYAAARFGRKAVFTVSLIALYTTLILSLCLSAQSFWLFLTLRVLLASFMCGFEPLYTMMQEVARPDQRSKLIGLQATSWTIGMCLLPLTAFLIRHWIGFMVVPLVLMLPFLSLVCLLPESGRWLVSQHRYEDAHRVLSQVARVNGRVVPHDLLDQLKAVNPRDISASNSEGGSNISAFEVLKHPRIRTRFLILTIAYIAGFATYGGLTLNFENMGGSEFVNWFLLSVVEVPSNLASWYCMQAVGRRWTTSATLVSGGLSLCVPVFLAEGRGVLVSSLIGKFLTNMSFNCLIQQSVELFPTPVRTQAGSYSTSIASFVTLGMPFVVSLGKTYSASLPLLIMGMMAVVAGVITSFLPETSDQNLPQTIEDGERLGVGRSFLRSRRSI